MTAKSTRHGRLVSDASSAGITLAHAHRGRHLTLIEAASSEGPRCGEWPFRGLSVPNG